MIPFWMGEIELVMDEGGRAPAGAEPPSFGRTESDPLRIDVIGRDRRLPALQVGDLVAIHDAGAYGAAMASNYNRRPLPVEVIVDDGRWRVIRRRQTIDDMLALES